MEPPSTKTWPLGPLELVGGDFCKNLIVWDSSFRIYKRGVYIPEGRL